ncbi:hypothetical protein Dimus_027510, partial [Dionaea muscipula]
LSQNHDTRFPSLLHPSISPASIVPRSSDIDEKKRRITNNPFLQVHTDSSLVNGVNFRLHLPQK